MTAEVTAALERVRPGDVLIVPGGKSGGRVAVLSTSPPARRRHPGAGHHPRSSARVARTARLPGSSRGGGPGGDARAVRPAQRRLPASGGIRADRGRLTTTRARRGRRSPAGSGGGRWPLAQATAAAASHPVASCPDARAHLRALERADRLTRDIERLERRVKGRMESLARQFDRVLRVLEAWGYVDGWSLTEVPVSAWPICTTSPTCSSPSAPGRASSTAWDAAELAGLVSVFTFEARGQGDRRAVVSHPAAAPRWAEIDIWRRAQRRRRRGRAAADPPARPRIRRPRARLGGGRGPGRGHRRRGDVRGRLRPQRQAADRSPAPARRSGGRAGHGQGRPRGRRPAVRGVVAASSVARRLSPTGRQPPFRIPPGPPAPP
jgi:hypothetical protein